MSSSKLLQKTRRNATKGLNRFAYRRAENEKTEHMKERWVKVDVTIVDLL